MKLSLLGRIAAALLTVPCLLTAWPAGAGTQQAAGDPSGICLAEARRAAGVHGVPAPVMIAITLTETGRMSEQGFLPWPWAFNVAGEGFWLPDRETATRFAGELQSRGKRNFDVGCFQINYRWHGVAFHSAHGMLEPRANADYAARFLRSLYDELGDWSLAAGAYHSRTPEFAARYRARFERMQALALTFDDDPPAPLRLAEVRENRFPLLRAGAASGASLVPASAGPGIRLIDLGRAKGSFWGD